MGNYSCGKTEWIDFQRIISFPSIPVKSIWDFYYYDEMRQKLGPFKNLERRVFLPPRSAVNQFRYFSKARFVVSVIALQAFKVKKFTIPRKDVNSAKILKKGSQLRFNLKDLHGNEWHIQCGYNELLALVYPDFHPLTKFHALRCTSM